MRIRLQTAELAEQIVPRLKSLTAAPSNPDITFRISEGPDGFRIFCGENYIGTEAAVTAVRGLLLQEIVRSCRSRDNLAVFHAGACGTNSQCVVFPAGTQSGKTTLAAVLMKSGLTFFSDDSVMLERGTLSVPTMPFALISASVVGTWWERDFPNSWTRPSFHVMGSRFVS